MISGYPHDDGGMFEVACASIEKQLSRPVRSTVVSLGGFPASRAEKYLKRKVLDEFHPDYVVIQFASTDAQRPLRKRNRLGSPKGNGIGSQPNPKGDDPSSYHRRSSNMFSWLRWELASLIGQARKLQPITPLPHYLAVIECMANQCKAAGATPVVLSPFCYGSRFTTKQAVAYVEATRELAKQRGFIFVDCMRELGSIAKRKILQHDGFHLTRLGHAIVGQTIANSIVASVLNQDSIECLQSMIELVS